MHRLGKKGTCISHKHHRLLLEGNKGREKREGNREKGTEGREHSYGTYNKHRTELEHM